MVKEQTVEVRWTRTIEGKAIIVMVDGSPSYTSSSTTQQDTDLGDVIDPEGNVEYDRDELLDFIIEEL